MFGNHGRSFHERRTLYIGNIDVNLMELGRRPFIELSAKYETHFQEMTVSIHLRVSLIRY